MIEIHVHHHFDPIGAPPSGPSAVDLILAAIQEMKMSLMDKLNTVLAETQETGTVADSLITLTNGIADQLRAVQQGEGTLDEVIANLNATQERIAAAVVANTPAAPPADDTGEV